jgi:hypothetical protein
MAPKSDHSHLASNTWPPVVSSFCRALGIAIVSNNVNHPGKRRMVGDNVYRSERMNTRMLKMYIGNINVFLTCMHAQWTTRLIVRSRSLFVQSLQKI